MSKSRKISESGEEICAVCSEIVAIFAIGCCDHVICYRCSTRMQVLCDQMYCAICRADLPKVVFQLKPSKFVDINTARYLRCHQLNICFENKDVEKSFIALQEHCCQVCDDRTPYKSFSELQMHMKRDHSLFYCDLCVQHFRLFTYERKLYDRKTLAQHRRVGDTDDTSHRGHPLCKFCEERYLDNDELVRHLRKDHYYCHFCDSDGVSNEFYSEYPLLVEHFRTAHYYCEEGECAKAQFTNAFRNEIDMKVHRASAHSKAAKKSSARREVPIQIDFNYTSARGGHARRGRGGDRRDRDGGGGSVITGEDYEEVQQQAGPGRRGGHHQAREVDSGLEVAILASQQDAQSERPYNRAEDDFPTLDGRAAAPSSDPPRGGDPPSRGANSLAKRLAKSSNMTVAESEGDDFPSLGGGGRQAPPRHGGTAWNTATERDFPALGRGRASNTSSGKPQSKESGWVARSEAKKEPKRVQPGPENDYPSLGDNLRQRSSRPVHQPSDGYPSLSSIGRGMADMQPVLISTFGAGRSSPDNTNIESKNTVSAATAGRASHGEPKGQRTGAQVTADAVKSSDKSISSQRRGNMHFDGPKQPKSCDTRAKQKSEHGESSSHTGNDFPELPSTDVKNIKRSENKGNTIAGKGGVAKGGDFAGIVKCGDNSSGKVKQECEKGKPLKKKKDKSEDTKIVENGPTKKVVISLKNDDVPVSTDVDLVCNESGDDTQSKKGKKQNEKKKSEDDRRKEEKDENQFHGTAVTETVKKEVTLLQNDNVPDSWDDGFPYSSESEVDTRSKKEKRKDEKRKKEEEKRKEDRRDISKGVAQGNNSTSVDGSRKPMSKALHETLPHSSSEKENEDTGESVDSRNSFVFEKRPPRSMEADLGVSCIIPKPQSQSSKPEKQVDKEAPMPKHYEFLKDEVLERIQQKKSEQQPLPKTEDFPSLGDFPTLGAPSTNTGWGPLNQAHNKKKSDVLKEDDMKKYEVDILSELAQKHNFPIRHNHCSDVTSSSTSATLGSTLATAPTCSTLAGLSSLLASVQLPKEDPIKDTNAPGLSRSCKTEAKSKRPPPGMNAPSQSVASEPPPTIITPPHHTIDSNPPPPGIAAPPPPGFSHAVSAPPGLGPSSAATPQPGLRAPPGLQASTNAPAISPPLEYLQPFGFADRNIMLLTSIQDVSTQDTFDLFKLASIDFRKGVLSAEEYYNKCAVLLGAEGFRLIFPELLALLPDIVKQQELLEAHQQSRSTRHKGKQAWSQADSLFVTCSVCGQVLVKRDSSEHLSSHDRDTDFPSLVQQCERPYNMSAWVRAK